MNNRSDTIPIGMARPMPDGPLPPRKACQWIEGKPDANYTGMCLKPTKPGTSWCPDHYSRVYRRKEDLGP